MDPFQRARNEAIALRTRLLAERSSDAVHVGDLLSPALIEQNLDLGIAFVPKGSSELGNADAVFRRAEDYIYVRDDFEDEDKAYLVAHELGHYVLEKGGEETSVATLKSLFGAEGSPAVVRVEAYGARERQELLANVFARELLLPRSIARNMYEAGLGPSTVASNYGIHLEVVRQQMLDAVMLPLVAASSELKAPPPPSADQEAAIKAGERYVNVVAGPGSGKTTTLIHRVRYLIEEQNVDPSHILVLTFTNKAAFELIERLRDAGISRVSDVWAGTFHAFGLEFLRKYHQCFDLDSDVIVADRLNSITLLNRQLPTLDLKYYKRVQDPHDWLPNVVEGIKRLKEEMVTPERYRNALPGLVATSDDLRLQREDMATLYECHERVLKGKKLVDFVDLVSKPAKALKEDRPQYGEIADKFQYVLVDEYQDVTFAMKELILQLAKNAKSLWVVGDVRQAIHHWRGASVHSLIRFDQTFKGHGSNVSLRTYPLAFNRRSSTEILEVVQQVGHQHVLEKTLELQNTTATAGKVGHMPVMIQCQPASAMADAVAACVQDLYKKGVPYGKQAVLSRWNSEIQHIAQRLRESSIPVLYIGELAHRREVKNLLCLMQLLVERLPRALVGLMGEPGLVVELEDIYTLLDASAKDTLLQRGRWRDKSVSGLSTKSRVALAKIKDLLQGQRRQSSPWSFICDVLLERRFGYPPLSEQSIEAHATRIALWQFAYATRAGDGEGKIATLPRFLLRQQLRQRIGETYADRELPAEAAGLDAIHMLSVHGSKGLEFEAVHVANVNIDDYGWDAAAWHGEPPTLKLVPPEALGSDRNKWEFEAAVERNNLLYVAVSRARRHLLMYENGEDLRKRAPQFAQLPAPYKNFSFTGNLVSKKVFPSPNIDVTPITIPFTHFETYARCPHQHWYRHVLNLPSEQQKDVSIRARWAIIAALENIAVDPAQSKHNAFAAAWQDHKLPDKAEDAQLWRHAKEVFEIGIRVLEQSQGSHTVPLTLVNGLKIQLPWLLLDKSGRRPRIEFLLFSRNLDDASKLWRPMLNGLIPQEAHELTMHCLLNYRNATFEPSRGITNTKAYKTAQNFRAGNREPITGRHCNRCPYLTFCPTILF